MGLFSVFLALSFAQQTGLIADAVTHWHLSDEGVPVPLATEQALDRLIHDDLMITVVRSVRLGQEEAANRAKELERNESDHDSERRERESNMERQWSAPADHAESYGVCSPAERQNVGPDEKCSAISAVPDENCLQQDRLTLG